MWTCEKVAATIDHAALKPSMTEEDIRGACADGKKFKVASACVRPSDVKLAAAELKDSGVRVSAVVGFPHGASRFEVKAAGGIRDWSTAVGYLEQGCARLGAGSTEAILSGATASEDY